MNILQKIFLQNFRSKSRYLKSIIFTHNNLIISRKCAVYRHNFNSFSTIQPEDDKKSFCSSINDKLALDKPQLVDKNTLVIETTKHRDLYKDIMEITKLRLCVLNLSVSLSTYIYYSAQLSLINLPLFAIGTLTIAMTTQVLNQIMETLYDKKMKRTQMRPLPKQRMTQKEAYTLALFLTSISVASYSACCPHAILFTGSILSLYIFCYTPLKRINNLAMHVGALVGALPALLGSFAVTKSIVFSFNDPAFLLASYIFCWQYPHFYGILYQNKDDYAKAGFKFISNDESRTKIAYAQLMVALLVIVGIAFKMREKKILNDYTLMAFLGFHAYNVVPCALFITNPSKYCKIMRVRSYTPFLIILAAFINASMSKNVDDK